jgi:hypothetical protein
MRDVRHFALNHPEVFASLFVGVHRAGTSLDLPTHLRLEVLLDSACSDLSRLVENIVVPGGSLTRRRDGILTREDDFVNVVPLLNARGYSLHPLSTSNQ